MTDIVELQKAARFATDESGLPVVQIPADLWETFVAEHGSKEVSQKDRIMALIHSWQDEPDDAPLGDEFRAFLRENRLNLTREQDESE